MKKYILIEKENKPDFENELNMKVSIGMKPLWETFRVVEEGKYHYLNFYIILEE